MSNVLLVIVQVLFYTSFITFGVWMSGFMFNCLCELIQNRNQTRLYYAKTYKVANFSMLFLVITTIICQLTGAIQLF